MDARVERSNAVGQQDWRDPPRVRRVAHLFPSRRSLSTSKHEVPSAIVAHLASQVGVPVDAYVAYDWRGRTIKYHRVQIRIALGFRETSVEDADNLVDWLTHEVVPHERGIDRVRAAVYARCRELRFEPPTQERIERLVRSALASHEQQFPGRPTGVSQQNQSKCWMGC